MEGIERTGLTLPWCRDLVAVPWQQQGWRLSPGGVSCVPMCQGQRGLLTETILSAHGTAQNPPCCAAGWGWIQHSLTQRSHSPEHCSSSTAVPGQPAHTSSPSVSDNSPNTSMGLLMGPARARMEPTHGRQFLLGVSFQCDSDVLVM